MASPTKKQKADLKVVILGAASVGKTSFMQRYMTGTFESTASTVGASFFLKQWKSSNIALWDTAGEERYAGLSSFYCRNAGAAIIAYDLTCDDSFHALRSRFIPLLQSALRNCLVVLVGMKYDLLPTTERAVDQKEALILAREVNSRHLAGIPYYEVSSLSGHNVNTVFDYIFKICLPSTSSESDGINISDIPSKQETKSGCAC